ncbi:MAG: hypothetical protein IJ054_06720 [Lachnospiraceae bacterium]|nr:hypothetical protein [Lachnospiraceae bacterium]
MKHKKSATLTVSAVAFVAALLVDLYMIIAYPAKLSVIIAISLIVVIDTYFLVDSILSLVDDIASINIDKQNELTKVQKGIYSVAKREEISRGESMSSLVDTLTSMKEENAKLMNDLLEQDKVINKFQVKKNMDNTTQIVNSNEKLAMLIAQMATANAKSSDEAIEILNDICKELEERNENQSNAKDYSHLRVMKSNVD